MTNVHQLTFGPFGENTYIIADDELNAFIIDPGMYYPEENTQFFDYINAHGLKPVRLLLTHAHLDHVFGVNWVNQTYKLVPELHVDDLPVYNAAESVALNYGLRMSKLISAKTTLKHDEGFTFGGSSFTMILTPGHSPGSICFYNNDEGYVISGDVLFQGSIGRTDLPGGSYDVLMNSIHQHMLTLEDSVMVYSGHGPMTTIGQERRMNPFLQA